MGLEALVFKRVSMEAGKELALLPGVDSKSCWQACALRPPHPVPFQPSHARRQARVGMTPWSQPGTSLAHQSAVHAGLFQTTFAPPASLGFHSCPGLWAKGRPARVTHRKLKLGAEKPLAEDPKRLTALAETWVFCLQQHWVRAGAESLSYLHCPCVFYNWLPGSAELLS